jgi:ketosteroid isomerase-like protein
MDIREDARRWASAWASGWPAKDVDAILARQAEDGDHWASMFRPYRGRAGLRDYLEEYFAKETRPARVWFAEPQVDGDTAAVEYWAQVWIHDQAMTISGCTVVRFGESGLAAEPRDYSHAEPGSQVPPASLFG